MKVTVDIKRSCHLVCLLTLTYIFGNILIQHYEWAALSAYGLTCSVVCQISNVILKFHEISGAVTTMKDEKPKTSERKKRGRGKREIKVLR
jgi:hypothetical protein